MVYDRALNFILILFSALSFLAYGSACRPPCVATGRKRISAATQRRHGGSTRGGFVVSGSQPEA